MYLNGYSLNLNGGSSGNGLTVYGGTDTGMFQETTLTVNSTGTGTWNFYGGNQNGGNLAGNPTIVINNTRSGLNTLSGGANIGTVTGNTSLVVNDSGGRISFNLWGRLWDQRNTANVTGNVSTKVAITNAATGFQLKYVLWRCSIRKYWWKSNKRYFWIWPLVYSGSAFYWWLFPRRYRNESCD